MLDSSHSTNITQLFRLDGQVAFLSGASGWLGRSLARALAEAGAHVIANGRNRDRLDSVVGELKQAGYSISPACFDITNKVSVHKHVANIGETYGRLDILVNNATSGRAGTIEDASADDFEKAYQVNVVAAFRLIQFTLPLLKHAARRRRGGASVVNMASMYGSVSPDPSIYMSSGENNPPCYGAAKAGLIQMTRYAACHLAADGIRVNCISPGPFPNVAGRKADTDFIERLKAKSPMRRCGDPIELQGPLLFLASDASSYVTGANLPVDGGWTSW